MNKTVEGGPPLSSATHPLLTHLVIVLKMPRHYINFNCYKKNVNNSRTMSEILDAFLIYLASVH